MRNGHRLLFPGALLVLGGLLTALPPSPAGGPTARAAVPTGDPVFSDPLTLENTWFPVRPGSVKVYRGRERGLAITVVEAHLDELRTFSWSGLDIPCRTVRETLFVAGALIETSTAWYAEADDGTVYAFGETTVPGEEPEDGEANEDDRSWVVGSRAPEDPPDTVSVPGPTVFMPAVPEVGDAWSPDTGHPETDETDEVRSVDARTRVPAGLFLGCIDVIETSPAVRGRSHKWYAPGVGVVRTRARTEWVRLEATTLGEPARPRRGSGRR